MKGREDIDIKMIVIVLEEEDRMIHEEETDNLVENIQETEDIREGNIIQKKGPDIEILIGEIEEKEYHIIQD